jgi:hypothetical protein
MGRIVPEEAKSRDLSEAMLVLRVELKRTNQAPIVRDTA